MKINCVVGRGLTVIAALVFTGLLNSCGGGVSASSDPTIPFSITPSTATAFSGVPLTLAISGGGLRTPFLIASSNASVIPITVASTGDNQIVLTPMPVTSQQSVIITISDQAGKTATANITVQPNLISADITVTGAAPISVTNCATTGIVCAGQPGTATLTVRQAGVPAGGRSVRYDVMQGNFRFPVDVAQTIFATTATVTSDEGGKATVILRADANASPQIATIRATDIASGAFRTATFLIRQSTINGGEFVTVPTEWKVNGAFKTVCPPGSTDYLVFGGTPPYNIRSSAPGTAPVFPTVTPAENPSRFSVTYPTLSCGTDGYQVIFTVTDSTGLSIPATLTVKPGTEDLVTPPSISLSPSALAVGCNQSAQVLVSVVNPGATPPTITTSIATPLPVATSDFQVLAPTAGVITITRSNTGTLASGTATTVGITVVVGAGSATPQNLVVTTPRVCP